MSRPIVVLLFLLAFLAATTSLAEDPKPAAPRCEPGAPHPDAPAELGQFGFLVGDFEVTLHAWTGEAWSPPRPGPRARWNGWYGMGGMMIYDEWYDPDPGLEPNSGRGVNVRFYDAEETIWKMMWIATTGKQTQDLRAELQDGKLVMWQVYPERPGFRADFTVEDEDHWYRVSYQPDDDGGWVPQFKLAASRIPCP
jgi:hypothetical protein